MLKKPWLRNSISAILLFFPLAFFYGEIFIDRLHTPSSSNNLLQPCILSTSAAFHQDPASSGFDIAPALPLSQAYAGKLLNTSHLRELPPPGIRTEFEHNRNIKGYPLTVVRNVCFDPAGDILLINITEDYLNSTISSSPSLQTLWSAGYNSTCNWCQKSNSRLLSEAPPGSKWVTGNTIHIIPYLGNIFHNFAERIWPHLVSHQFPLNRTSMQPVDHFMIHRFTTWIQQAESGNHERENFLLQFRVLAELSPASSFIVLDDPHPVCFNRLTLDCSSCDRMSELLGEEIFSSAIHSYREAAFNFFGVPEPVLVSSPPGRLRVAVYGRSDTRRRRVANVEEVVEHLRGWREPPLDILVVDELLRGGLYNQTMAETVSLFSQTDVLITVHGANTWGAMFMPRGAAVIEIYGPCGPGTWIEGVARALKLKHDVSNPWGVRVASAVAGNTTECEGYYQTPDFTLDLSKLDRALKQLAMPEGPRDRFPLHWLYDWKNGRYWDASSDQ